MVFWEPNSHAQCIVLYAGHYVALRLSCDAEGYISVRIYDSKKDSRHLDFLHAFAEFYDLDHYRVVEVDIEQQKDSVS
jgi:hypothetical protein